MNTGAKGQCLIAYAPNNSEVIDVINKLVETLDERTKTKIGTDDHIFIIGFQE